ncbi:MAG: hypothetical protein ACE5IZ_07735 [Dehalococcoidia bacterium]
MWMFRDFWKPSPTVPWSDPSGPASGPSIASAIKLCRERFWAIALAYVIFLALFIITLPLSIWTLFTLTIFPLAVALCHILGSPRQQAVAANRTAWGKALRKLPTAFIYGVGSFLGAIAVSLIPWVGGVLRGILGTVLLLGFAVVAFENVGPLSIWPRLWHLVKLGRSQRLLPSLARLWLLGLVISTVTTTIAMAIIVGIVLLFFIVLNVEGEAAFWGVMGLSFLVGMAAVMVGAILTATISLAWISEVYGFLRQAEAAS